MESERMPRCAAAVLPPAWNLSRGGEYYDYANGMVLDSENNAYLANEVNFTWGQGKTDAEIAKYSPRGELLWNRSLGGLLYDSGYGVAIDNQGSVYLAGATESWGAGDYDALLAKYDANGNWQWNITWGDANYQWGDRVSVDSTGNIYLAGENKNDVFIAKFSPDHLQLWNFTWATPGYDNLEDMAIDASGNVYIAGWNRTISPEREDAFLAKLNTGGTSEWNRTLNTPNNERGNGVALDSSGNIYFVGWSNLTTNYDVFIKIYFPNGDISWEQTFLGPGADCGIAIAVDAKKNSHICGSTTSSGAGSTDVFLLKLDASGTTMWNWTWGGPGAELASDIAIGTDGFLYICGYTYSWNMGDYPNALLLKFHTSGAYVPEFEWWVWVIITAIVAAVAVAILGWYVASKPRSSKK